MKQNKISHTGKQIANKTDLTTRQVQFYTDQGVVTPEVDLGEGRGKSRRYSDHNLVQFMIVKGLVDLGMTIGKIKEILRYLETETLVKEYESTKGHERGLQLFITIFKADDGSIRGGWRFMNKEDEKKIVVDANTMKNVDTCVVINFGRVASAAGER